MGGSCCRPPRDVKGLSAALPNGGTSLSTPQEPSIAEASDHDRVNVDDACDVVDMRLPGHVWSGSTLQRSHSASRLPVRKASNGDVMMQEDSSANLTTLFTSDRFVGPRDDIGQAAAGLVKRMIRLVDVVDAESEDISDHDWLGPPACEGDILGWLLSDEVLKMCGLSILDFVCALCGTALGIVGRQPALVDLRAPVKIFGDIHGQLRDLLLFFNEFGRPTVGRGGDIEVVSYVFNGDWVDRGAHQLEVMISLLALKVTYPERVWLIRGNHEDEITNEDMQDVGFKVCCEKRFGKEDGLRVFKSFHNMFNYLPLCATVESKVLVLHGGIGDGGWSLSYVRDIVRRPLTPDNIVDDMIVYNMLWSDPVPEDQDGEDPDGPNATFGVHESTRGSKDLKAFGRDITWRFCDRNNLEMIVRSHQCTKHGYGYTLMHGGRLMRVFSARHYDNRYGNAAAMLLLGYKRPRANAVGDRGLVVRAKVIRPPPTEHSNLYRLATHEAGRSSTIIRRSRTPDGAASAGNWERLVSGESTASRPSASSSTDYTFGTGVEVDEQCDVVNKSADKAHAFGHEKQVWQSSEGCQLLNRKAVVGRPYLCGDRFVGPRDMLGQMAGELVARTMELVDLASTELEDINDSEWRGPPECSGDIFEWLMEPVKKCFPNPHEFLTQLFQKVEERLKKETPCVDIRAPVKIFGDLRGHIRDLLLFFDQFGRPTVGRGGDIETVTYVFNGGWIGNSRYQLELVVVLLSLKLTYPERFWLLQGLPESMIPTGGEGDLYKEFRRRFKGRAHGVFESLQAAFASLPLAVVIGSRVLVVYGGIGDGDWTLEELRDSQSSSNEKLKNTVLWSEPKVGEQREKLSTFSRQQTEEFCRSNQIGLIVCSGRNAALEDGYTLMHANKLMLTFSGRSTEDRMGDGGAMLVVGYKRPRGQGDRGLQVRAKVIKPPPAADFLQRRASDKAGGRRPFACMSCIGWLCATAREFKRGKRSRLGSVDWNRQVSLETEMDKEMLQPMKRRSFRRVLS